MNNTDFNNLIESVKQAGEIKRGIRKPSRKTEIKLPQTNDNPKNPK